MRRAGGGPGIGSCLARVGGLSAGAALLALWFGLLFPDPYFVDGPGILHRVLMWAGRLGIPPMLLGITLLDRRVRRGQADPRVVWLLGGGLAGGLLLLYPPASYLHERSLAGSAGRIHPYLQLDPPSYRERERDDGPLPLRIFCVGGSTTEFVDSSGRGWPERVEVLLRAAHPETPVEVHNLGRQWYTTLHTLVNYEANLRPHQPDVVLVMHAINDVLHNADFSYFSRGPFREDYGHFYGPLQRLANPRTLPRRAWEILAAIAFHRPRVTVEAHEFPGLRPFARNLRTLVDLARLDGTRVVLMTEPNLYKEPMTPAERSRLYMLNREAVGPDRQWSLATARRAMASYNGAVRRIAIEEGVRLIDLESEVPKTLEYFSDDVHYRDRAFDKVAEGVARGLEAGDLLRRATLHGLD